MRNWRVSENATRTPGELVEAEVNLICGYPTTTLPKSTVMVGIGIGSTGAGQTSLIRVKLPCEVSWAWVTVMRTRSVLTFSVNGTAFCTASLPVTVAAVCQSPSLHTSTV